MVDKRIVKNQASKGKKKGSISCCGTLVPNSVPANGMCVNPDQCASMMKVLSDPNRIRIVRALIAGPSSVSGISERTGLDVHRISHHLGRMRLAGIVECVREGRSIIYRISEHIAVANGLDLGCACIMFRSLP
jgi:DNA-binding transcriptional ArsR family regulator